jgi:hypothetical protein
MTEDERRAKIRSNGNDWVTFMRDQALRAHGLRTFGTPPAGLEVDKACPDCNRADRWVRLQVIGETPGCSGVHERPVPGNPCQCGRMDVEHKESEWGQLCAIPPQRAGVKMYCYNCGAQFTYRDVPFTEREQAGRTVRLIEQAKIGRMA